MCVCVCVYVCVWMWKWCESSWCGGGNCRGKQLELDACLAKWILFAVEAPPVQKEGKAVCHSAGVDETSCMKFTSRFTSRRALVATCPDEQGTDLNGELKGRNKNNKSVKSSVWEEESLDKVGAIPELRSFGARGVKCKRIYKKVTKHFPSNIFQSSMNSDRWSNDRSDNIGHRRHDPQLAETSKTNNTPSKKGEWKSLKFEFSNKINYNSTLSLGVVPTVRLSLRMAVKGIKSEE